MTSAKLQKTVQKLSPRFAEKKKQVIRVLNAHLQKFCRGYATFKVLLNLSDLIGRLFAKIRSAQSCGHKLSKNLSWRGRNFIYSSRLETSINRREEC